MSRCEKCGYELSAKAERLLAELRDELRRTDAEVRVGLWWPGPLPVELIEAAKAFERERERDRELLGESQDDNSEGKSQKKVVRHLRSLVRKDNRAADAAETNPAALSNSED